MQDIKLLLHLPSAGPTPVAPLPSTLQVPLLAARATQMVQATVKGQDDVAVDKKGKSERVVTGHH